MKRNMLFRVILVFILVSPKSDGYPSKSVPDAPYAPFPMSINQTMKYFIQFTMGFQQNSNGGSPITKYTIYYGLNVVNETTKYKQFCNITSSEISRLNEYNYPNCTGNLNITQLSQLYNFVVEATNSVGNSAYSSYSPCIIPQENIYLFMCSMILPPSSIDNSSFIITPSSYEIDIKWAPPTCTVYNSPILQYQLQRTDWWNDEPFTNITLPNNGLSLYAQLNGLLAGITYNIRIRPINQYGGGNWSNFEVTTPDTGACGDYYDTNILKYNCNSFSSTMPQIWLNCDGNDECQTTQIENEFGFSDNCTSCWVQLNDCTMGICFQECMHESPEKCQACIQTNCSPETEACTGYPIWPITKKTY